MTGRRRFLAGAAAFGALAGRAAAVPPGRPVKFLFMSDTHIERDFWERDHPVYTCWKPGNHAALVRTYAFINEDPLLPRRRFRLLLRRPAQHGLLARAGGAGCGTCDLAADACDARRPHAVAGM